MLALIKFRAKFFLRNKKILFSFLIPFIFDLLILIIVIKNKIFGYNIFKNKKSFKTGEGYFFNKYNHILNYFNNIFIKVNNKEDCHSLELFFKNENITNSLKCGEEINNDYDYDIIELNHTDEKYEFKLIQNTNNIIFDNIISTNIFNDINNDSELNNSIEFNQFSNNYYKLIEFLSLFSKFLINEKTKINVIDKNIKITTGTFSNPEYTGFNINKNFIIFYLLLIFTYFPFFIFDYFFNIRIVKEKEKKLNILLSGFGISKTKNILSWILLYLILIFIPIIICISIIQFAFDFYNFLFEINFLLYIINLLSISFCLTTCISSTKYYKTIFRFYDFYALLFWVFFLYNKIPYQIIFILAFFPNINIIYCSGRLYQLQAFKQISFKSLDTKQNAIDILLSFAMYIISSISYTGIGIYNEYYQDSGFRIIHCIKSLFMKRSMKKEINNNSYRKIESTLLSQFETHHQELSIINQNKKEQNKYLKIFNINKNYKSLNAVNDFNLELFSDEIFCLLGHNGAGKSTLINIISGSIEPDEGNIFFNGKSLIYDKKYLFQNIGICYQENIFFDYLTVKEHLELVYRIKGKKINKLEINNLIINIGLSEKLNCLCGNLSGGQKRKLCSSLALINESKIILLDEPTSGMDFTSKKIFWDFLKNYKKNRIILILLDYYLLIFNITTCKLHKYLII